MKTSLVIALLLGILGFGVALGTIRWVISEGKTRDEEQAKTNRALCEVIAVQLSSRADRKQTIKLFSSIRQQNPPLFDKLVRRAARGDRRIAAAKKDLPCETLPPLRTPNAPNSKKREHRAHGHVGRTGGARTQLPKSDGNGNSGGGGRGSPKGHGRPPSAPDNSGGAGGQETPEPGATIKVSPPDLGIAPVHLPDVGVTVGP